MMLQKAMIFEEASEKIMHGSLSKKCSSASSDTVEYCR